MNRVSILVVVKVFYIWIILNCDRHVFERANHWACEEVTFRERLIILKISRRTNLERNCFPSHVLDYYGEIISLTNFTWNGNMLSFRPILVYTTQSRGGPPQLYVFSPSKCANIVEVGQYGMVLDRHLVVDFVSGA